MAKGNLGWGRLRQAFLEARGQEWGTLWIKEALRSLSIHGNGVLWWALGALGWSQKLLGEPEDRPEVKRLLQMEAKALRGRGQRLGTGGQTESRVEGMDQVEEQRKQARGEGEVGRWPGVLDSLLLVLFCLGIPPASGQGSLQVGLGGTL